MQRRFDLLVFDWDGTLMDSASFIVSAIQAAARDLGLPVPSDGASRHIIGLGLQEAIALLFPDLDQSEYGPYVDRYRHYYLSQDHEIPLFAGVPEAIQHLCDAGFILAVATGKSRKGLNRALAHSGLGGYFHASRCADESFSKPHPAMLLDIMALTGAEPGRTLMIGDTTHDLQMAANAGVAGLGAAYGAHPRADLDAMTPLAVLDDFPQLYQWLKKNI